MFKMNTKVFCHLNPIIVIVLEHGLNRNDRVAIRESVFFGRIGKLFIDHDDVLGQCDARFNQIVQTVQWNGI